MKATVEQSQAERKLASEEKIAKERNLSAKEVALIQAASANRPGEHERIMGNYLKLRETDPQAAARYLNAYQEVTGSAQRSESAAEKNSIARQKLLTGENGFMYTNALKVMNDPKSTPEQKEKAKLTITSMEQAAGIQSTAQPQTATTGAWGKMSVN